MRHAFPELSDLAAQFADLAAQSGLDGLQPRRVRFQAALVRVLPRDLPDRGLKTGPQVPCRRIDLRDARDRSWRSPKAEDDPMRLPVAILVCAALLALFGQPGAAEDALTNDDVVQLTAAGLAPVAIVAKIESSASAFDTSVAALVALAGKGVDSLVIAAMVGAGGSAGTGAAAGNAAGTPRGGTAAPGAQPKAIPGSTFRESLRAGDEGPEMVVIPAGRFRMGCLSNDDDCRYNEKPVHEVTIGAPFALSVHEVTFEDYDRFTYPNKVADKGWGRGRYPAINVSWNDAQDYVAWLSSQTGAEYRLPSEAEWEYAARAGTTTKYSWGDEIGTNRANWNRLRTAPAGSFGPNGFGLYDMHGNVYEWVADCWNGGGYQGAPSDGGAWLQGDCARRVLRGGSWNSSPGLLRSAVRSRNAPGYRNFSVGFRVARTLTP